MDKAREHMVEDQIVRRGIRDARVLEAMRTVPRHEFVSPAWQAEAYADEPLPIGHDQTISQPYVVALMSEQLHLSPAETVLEIGTGSGYQAAILSRLAAQVYSIEIVAPLAEAATATLSRLGYRNVQVKTGDGAQGWPEHAPFDAIIVTCAPSQIPPLLIDQLKEGGRMMIPVGKSHHQELLLLKKKNGRVLRQALLLVRFVPMTGTNESPSPSPTPAHEDWTEDTGTGT